jgi:drug/metabolite transporter (DMT)-like permease
VQQRTGLLLAIVSALGFSTLAIFAKINLDHGGNGTMLLAVRFLVAAAVLWGVLLWRRQLPPLRLLLVPALMGLLGYSTMSTLFVSSVQYISPSLAGILLYTHPAIVTVLVALLDRQRISARRLLALLLASTGVVLVLGQALGVFDIRGILMVSGASLVYSCYIVVGGKFLRGLTPMQTTAVVSTAAGTVFLVWGTLGGKLVAVDAVAWGAMLGAAVCASLVAVLCFFAAMARIGPGPTAIASSVEPVGTAIFDAVIWGAAFTGLQVVGGVLVLLSVILLSHSNSSAALPLEKSGGVDSVS